MRRVATAAALLLALGALPAAKPVPPDDLQGDAAPQLTRQAWRERGVPICVGRLRVIPAFTPDDLETICGCTFDTYLEGHGTNPLPSLENDRIPVAMEARLLGCTAQARPDQRETVRRLGAIWPPGSPMAGREAQADLPKPVNDVDTAPPVQSETRGESGGGFWEWVRSIHLPDWLTGPSALWWIAIGIFVFGMLLLKIRGRDPRKDLSAPPSSMRRGAPPQPPRRPDLPR